MVTIFYARQVKAKSEAPGKSSRWIGHSFEAATKLEHLSHEAWAIDWIKNALVCKHGVAVNNLDAIVLGIEILRELIDHHHSAINRV